MPGGLCKCFKVAEDSFAENDAIRSIDLDGLERLIANTQESQNFLQDYIELMYKDDILAEVGVVPFQFKNHLETCQ